MEYECAAGGASRGGAGGSDDCGQYGGGGSDRAADDDNDNGSFKDGDGRCGMCGQIIMAIHLLTMMLSIIITS